MINSKIYIDNRCLGQMQLVAVTPVYYAGGVRQSSVQSIAYEVVLPEHQYDKLRITISGLEPQIAEPAISETVMVAFDNLRVKPYVREGRLAFSATATGIRAIPPVLAGSDTKDKGQKA